MLTDALYEARRPVAGATGLLVHHRARGEVAFDYLINHALRVEAESIPDRLWFILSRHLTPGTVVGVGFAAARNGRADIARQLAMRSPDAALYAALGDSAGLGLLADTGDSQATERLAELLAKRNDVEELERRADAGDEDAAEWLADLLAERDDVVGLERPSLRWATANITKSTSRA
jgi:hypothetical protein